MSLATALQVVGLALVAAAAFCVAVPLGLLAAGVGAVLFGLAVEKNGSGS